MTGKDIVALRERLLELSGETDGVISALAMVFAGVVQENAWEDGCLAVREIVEKISATTEQMISGGQSPTKVVDALLRIDNRLFEKKAIEAPFAMRLAPLAMERALHAEKMRWFEANELNLVSASPVIRADERTVMAAPVGLVTDDGLNAFADRVLAEVLTRPPKRVILVLSGLAPAAVRHRIWESLASDLKSQKVRLERVGG